MGTWCRGHCVLQELSEGRSRLREVDGRALLFCFGLRVGGYDARLAPRARGGHCCVGENCTRGRRPLQGRALALPEGSRLPKVHRMRLHLASARPAVPGLAISNRNESSRRAVYPLVKRAVPPGIAHQACTSLHLQGSLLLVASKSLLVAESDDGSIPTRPIIGIDHPIRR